MHFVRGPSHARLEGVDIHVHTSSLVCRYIICECVRCLYICIHEWILLVFNVQAKTVFQAEIDSTCETIDFFRFAVQQGLELQVQHTCTCTVYTYIINRLKPMSFSFSPH